MNERRRTIVSVTPLAVERDSRTFKQAASFQRAGHRSIVVELSPSQLDRASLPFELISAGSPLCSTGSAHPLPSARRDVSWSSRARLAGGRLPAFVRLPLAGGAYFARYLRDFVLRTLPLLPPADLYWLHGFYQYPAVRVAAGRSGTPVVYDAHDFYPGMLPPEELKPHERYAVMPLHRFVEARCIESATEVVTVSDGVAGLYAKHYGREPAVIRNADDVRMHDCRRPGLRESLRLSPDELILVVVGQAKSGRAIPQAISALQALPEHVHLAFVGSGYETYLGPCVPASLMPRVHHLAPVRPYEVGPFIASADVSLILYFPQTVNYLNALPNGFFQSVTAGLPILYPELPEIGRLARRHQLGLPIAPLEPASIATAVARYLARPALLAETRGNVARARRTLSWEHEEARLLAIVDRLMSARTSAR